MSKMFIRIVTCVALLVAGAAPPALAKTPEVKLKLSWFEGLKGPGACDVLPANLEFLTKLAASEPMRRVALVVGNGGYELPKWALANPRKDAVAVARTLQSVGFEVYLMIDGSEDAITACTKQAAAKPADLGVVYYSGHGLQREYTNYLVATDLTKVDASLKGLVSLDGIVGSMRKSDKAVLVFLDACRNNPLATSGGGPAGLAPEQVVARAMTGEPGGGARSQASSSSARTANALSGGELFVAFSTSPNSTASDGTGDLSPFTSAFLAYATTPGWSIQRVLAEVTKSVGELSDWAQTPWTRSSLTGQVFLNGGVDPDEALRASRLKAKKSRDLLAKGDKTVAIIEALRALPNPLTESDIKTYPEAYEALYRAVRSHSLRLPITGAVHTAFSSDGKRVATVSAEVGEKARKEALKLWDVSTGMLVAELLPLDRSGTVGSTLGPASFSSDGKLVAHVDPGSGRPMVWDATTGVKVVELPPVPGISKPIVTPPRVALSPSGQVLLAIYATSGVHIYDVAAKRVRWSMKVGMGTMAAAISPDEKLLVTATATGSSQGGAYQIIRIIGIDLISKKQLWSHDVRESTWGAYGAIFNPDGRYVGITTSSDAIILLDIASGETRRIPVARVGTSGFSFSPNARYIAVTPEDYNSAPVFRDVATGQSATLPYTEAAILDIVHNKAGEEIGVPWFPDAGDIWRKGVVGSALIEAAKAALPPDEQARASQDRVQFR